MKKKGKKDGLCLLAASMLSMLAVPATAVAESEFEPEIEGSLVSSYVWRGMYQAGASFQPSLGVGYKGLSLSAWGSTDFNADSSKEVDLTLGYTFASGLGIAFTDYWWEGQSVDRYFHYSKPTGHHFEVGLSYTLPGESLPLSISWNTFFAGEDNNANGSRAWSSFVELDYPFSINTVDFNITLGASPYKSQGMYGCNSFAVTEAAIKGTYTIEAGKSLSIPLFTQLVFNPRTEEAHLVFGITLTPKL